MKRLHRNALLIAALMGVSLNASASRIQQQGIVTTTDCFDRGISNATCLPTDYQIWDSTNLQTLGASIANGYLSGQVTENRQSGTTYTFSLTDKGKLVSFSNASAIEATIPPNSSAAFTIGTKINLISNGDGAVSVLPGAGVTIKSYNMQTNLLGKFAEATLLKTATDAWYMYGSITGGFIHATGGTITTNGNFKVHRFTAPGTFQVISGSGTVASLVVAGGGGTSDSGGSGGGGGGGVVYTTPGATYDVTSGPISVVVGNGGIAGVGVDGGNGVASSFDSISAVGGGGGGNTGNGHAGGSGGGGGYSGSGGTNTLGQGFVGGAGRNTTATSGGGGGGAGGAGTAANDTGHGNGGLGVSNSITGSAVLYASGGGGASSAIEGGTAGTASAGGGTAGGSSGGSDCTNAAPNTGGGAGGGYSVGCVGGSGVVILTYQFQ